MSSTIRAIDTTGEPDPNVREQPLPAKETIPNPFLECPPVDDKGKRISRVLRTMGAIVLIASAVSFAMQSWAGLEAISRYYTFLGFTVVLSAAGVFCGLRMKEDKGARTFLALAAAFLPAHFIQLGALVLSVTKGTPPGLPAFFVLQAPTVTAAVIALAIAAPLLIVIAYVGFSALSRGEARGLTLHYVVANILLLLPVRDPNVIGLLALLAFVDLALFDVRHLIAREMMRTTEGIISRVMLFAPILCLILRNLVLYDGTALMLSALLAIMAIALFSIVPRNLENKGTIALSEVASFVAATYSWLLFADGAIFHASPNVAHSFGTLISYLPVAIIISVMSLFVSSEGATYRKLAGWLAIGTVVVQLFTVPGLISSFFCVVTAVITVAGAFAIEEKGLLYSGIFGLTVGILYHLRYAAELYAMSPWISLAVTGIIIVIASSYIERNFRKICDKASVFRGVIEGWK